MAEDKIKKVIVEDELKSSYLDYSMSVIVGRALPDVRDGLKPVHRRILFAMNEMGMFHNKPFKKCARIVGETLGKFHPHGDIAVYDALIRMAQDFSLRYPLIAGQGNVGCFTGDTEIKLLDGTSKSFKELCKKYKKGKIFYVYSVNKDGKIVVGEAKNPRITKKYAKLVEVILDTGEKIRCTPNHKFLLKDLKYKKAKDLTPNDSLMPGYFKLSPIRGNTELKEYLMVKNDEKYNFVHDIVDNYNLEKGIYTISNGPVRHHIDFNKFNNDPNNIKRILWDEHTQIHNKHIKELWKTKEFRRKQAEGIRSYYKNHPEHVERLKEILRTRNKDKGFIRKHLKKRKEVWKNQKLRQKLSDKLKKHYDEHPEKRNKVSKFSKEMWSDPKIRIEIINRMREVMGSAVMKEKLSKIQQKRILEHPEIRELVSKRFKELYKNNPHLRKIISERSKNLWKDENYRAKLVNKNYNHFKTMAKKAWQDENYRKLQIERVKKLWDNKKFRETFISGVRKGNIKRIEENPNLMKDLAKKAAMSHRINWKNPEYKNRVIKSKILYYVNRLIAIVGENEINKKNYNKYKINNAFPRFENAIKYFKNINEMVVLAKEYNHHIINIKSLDYTKDVYDITVNEHHNFLLDCGIFVHNSVDGDNAAAMRYVESKLSKISGELLTDIEKDTVDFTDNFDGSLKEPLVLPGKLPNLLINGSSGIAVGMATNIPPHNIHEICDATIALIDNPNLDINDLIKFVKGPDFPTGALIFGTNGIREAYKTGRGKVIVRAKTEIENKNIIVTEIPYQVNKSLLIENIANLVNEKRIEGISDIRDESNKQGIRIVIETKINPEIVLNNLFKNSELETSFGIILLALVDNQPRILNLKQIIEEYIKHRIIVVKRRTQFDLDKAEKRAHILEGLKIALINIDSIVPLLKKSRSVEDAKIGLIKNYNLSTEQALAILDMKLQKLTSLETEKLNEEYNELLKLIKELKDILASEQRILNIIKDELVSLKNEYGDKRKTLILESTEEIETEDLVKEQDLVITLTHTGYIKSTPLELYKQQKRGGKGVIATGTKEEDFVEELIVANSHDTLLLFTNKGIIHWLRAYQVPEATRYAKGSAVVNLLNLDKDERITSILSVKKFSEDKYLFMGTKNGLVKKTSLAEYSNPRKGGIIAINLKENDELVDVKITDGTKKIIIVSDSGRAVRFEESDVKPVGRNSMGVRGISLRGASVIGLEICDSNFLLTITENGYGKRTDIEDYRLISRGGSGVTDIKINERNGKVAGIKIVNENDEVIAVTKDGSLIRINVSDISVIGRNTLGVRVMKLEDKDKVISIAKIITEEKIKKDFTLGAYG